MNSSVLLVILYLAKTASARSVHDLEVELLQVIREMVDDQPQDDDENKDIAIPPQQQGEPPSADDAMLTPEATSPEEQGTPDAVEPPMPGDETHQEPLNNALDSMDAAPEEHNEPGTVEEPPSGEEKGDTNPEDEGTPELADELSPAEDATSPEDQSVPSVDEVLPPDEETTEANSDITDITQEDTEEPQEIEDETPQEMIVEQPPGEDTPSLGEQSSPEIVEEQEPLPVEEDTPPETMEELPPADDATFPEEQDAEEPFPVDEETPEEPGDELPPAEQGTSPDEQGAAGEESPPIDNEEPGEISEELQQIPEQTDERPSEESIADTMEGQGAEGAMEPITTDKEEIQEILDELQHLLPEKTDGQQPGEDGNPQAEETVEEGEGAQSTMEAIQSPEESPINKPQVDTIKVAFEGKEFMETVDFDDDAGSETIEVSASGDIAEVNIRHCFKEGETLECFPGKRKCFLLSMASTGEPGLQQQKEDIQKCQKDSPSGKVNVNNAEKKTNNWVVKEQVSREDLPGCLADFQPDCEVYSAEKAPEGADIVTDDVEETQGKRYISGGSGQCEKGASTVKRLRRKLGQCRYSCGEMVCDDFFDECVCCPESVFASQCLICKA